MSFPKNVKATFVSITTLWYTEKEPEPLPADTFHALKMYINPLGRLPPPQLQRDLRRPFRDEEERAGWREKEGGEVMGGRGKKERERIEGGREDI